MKKLMMVIMAAVIAVCAGAALAGCGAGTANVATELDLAKASRPKSVQYVDSMSLSGMTKIKSKNVNLTCDLTLDTSGEYFASNDESGRVFGNMTFEGNNHTITVTGESSGKLGNFMSMFIRRADNCTFNNLKIVYNLPVKLSTKSGGKDYVGGLVGWSNSCIFNNCTVVFSNSTDIDFYTSNNGFHTYSFGGIAGYADSSAFNGCHTVMTCDYIGRDFGGIVGRASNCTVTKCDSNVTLTSSNLENCYIGGLAGYIDGSSLSESRVTVNRFDIKGKPQGWRNETAYSGLLAGSAKGNSSIKDCYADLNCDYYAESGKSGVFATTVKTGLISAEASDKTAVENVYIDIRSGTYSYKYLTVDGMSGTTYLLTTRNFIHENSSSHIENIYCLGKDNIFSDFKKEIYDTNSNVCPQYKYVFTYDEIQFDGTVWTADENGKPVFAEQAVQE